MMCSAPDIAPRYADSVICDVGPKSNTGVSDALLSFLAMSRVTSRIALCTALLAALTACGMLAVKEQQAKLDANCRIGGQVDAERRDAAPLTVVLARQTGDSWQVADHFVLERPGLWGFAASPGTYGVVAFQDLNRDLKLQRDEPYLGVDNNRLITCEPGGRRTDLALHIPADGRSRFGETLDISALQVRTFDEQMDVSLTQVTAVGEISNLSDPRFDQAIAEDGLWRPFDFLFKGHPGVYFLGAYDSTKIPVLFVHGINGSPQNFKTLIERLDQRRFQPWVYYYPSGASLPNVASHLTQTMRQLQVQYGFGSFAVVAHSMGGLVSRGFLQRYREGGGGRVGAALRLHRHAVGRAQGRGMGRQGAHRLGARVHRHGAQQRVPELALRSRSRRAALSALYVERRHRNDGEPAARRRKEGRGERGGLQRNAHGGARRGRRL